MNLCNYMIVSAMSVACKIFLPSTEASLSKFVKEALFRNLTEKVSHVAESCEMLYLLCIRDWSFVST